MWHSWLEVGCSLFIIGYWVNFKIVISRRMPEIRIGLEENACDNDPDSCLRRNDHSYRKLPPTKILKRVQHSTSNVHCYSYGVHSWKLGVLKELPSLILGRGRGWVSKRSREIWWNYQPPQRSWNKFRMTSVVLYYWFNTFYPFASACSSWSNSLSSLAEVSRAKLAEERSI